MAKPSAKKPDADQDLDALRARVEAILHSNGFEGTKAAGEITAAVSKFVGGDVAPKQDQEETEAA